MALTSLCFSTGSPLSAPMLQQNDGSEGTERERQKKQLVQSSTGLHDMAELVVTVSAGSVSVHSNIEAEAETYRTGEKQYRADQIGPVRTRIVSQSTILNGRLPQWTMEYVKVTVSMTKSVHKKLSEQAERRGTT